MPFRTFTWESCRRARRRRAGPGALYVDEGDPPVPRRTADRLFLTALREPGPQKGGAFRHWLMWAAVSSFGTMRWRLGLVFGLHLVTVWALTIWGLVWAWGDGVAGVGWNRWQLFLVVLAGLAFLLVIGSSWRAGVDLRGGWLVPMLLACALVVVPLANEWTYPFRLELAPFTLLAAALGLTLVGPLWGLWVDPDATGLALADGAHRAADRGDSRGVDPRRDLPRLARRRRRVPRCVRSQDAHRSGPAVRAPEPQDDGLPRVTQTDSGSGTWARPRPSTPTGPGASARPATACRRGPSSSGCGPRRSPRCAP
jgi:hypothetical protein